jgi:hypothetical protein
VADIKDFSDRCQSELIKCPGQLIDQAVVDAIIRFCQDTYVFKYGFEASILSTDVDTSDNNAVTVDLSSVSGDPYADKRPLDLIEFRIDNAPFKVERRDMSTDITNIDHIRYGSKRFFNFPSTTEIKLYPLEEEAADLFIEAAFVPVLGITTIDDVIYDEHHEAVEARAKSVLMGQKDKPWSNMKESIMQGGIYSREMARARIRVEQQYTQRSTVIQSKYIF